MRANGSLRTDIDVGTIDDSAPKSWKDVKDKFRQVIFPDEGEASTSQTDVKNGSFNPEKKE